MRLRSFTANLVLEHYFSFYVTQIANSHSVVGAYVSIEDQWLQMKFLLQNNIMCFLSCEGLNKKSHITCIEAGDSVRFVKRCRESVSRFKFCFNKNAFLNVFHMLTFLLSSLPKHLTLLSQLNS